MAEMILAISSHGTVLLPEIHSSTKTGTVVIHEFVFNALASESAVAPTTLNTTLVGTVVEINAQRS